MREILIQENPALAGGFIDVSFENRDFSNDEFSDIPFRNAVISKSVLTNSRFLGNRISLVEWQQLDANKVQLQGIVSNNFVISYSKGIRLQMRDSKNTGLVFKNCEAHNSRFEKSVFINSNFVDNEMYKAGFIECIFIDTAFTSNKSVELYGMQSTVFDKCTFINCSFKNINISGSQMTDCIYVQTTFNNVNSDEIEAHSISIKE